MEIKHKGKLKSVLFSIKEFSKKEHKQMSHAQRHSMKERLQTTFKDLHIQLGRGIPHIRHIKSSQVQALVDYWKSKSLSAGTMKNRLSDLRYICKVYKKENTIKSNDHYGIEKRSFTPTQNKAIIGDSISKIEDEMIKASLNLQKEFGLRREESLKIIPDKAYHPKTEYAPAKLKLDGSWTKGGIPRTIIIHHASQIKSIEAAIKVAKGKSLIPPEKKYIEHRNHYEYVTRSHNLKNLHGLRHAYAQKRYEEITNLETNGNGWKSPINEGLLKKDMTFEQKKIDLFARQIISQELGHSRIAIVKNYIG